MSVQHTSRKGKAYYLHVKTTASGRANYFFSMDASGPLVAAVPAGYEIYENVGGQVFLRKKTAPVIRPEELALVEAALREHGEPWQYRAEVKKNAVVVYENGDNIGRDDLDKRMWGRALTAAEKLRHARYMAVLRFALADKKSRTFVAERFCFRGSIDDWIHIGGPAGLATLLRRFVKHLGRESMYELF